jgi:hypothetical protein
MFCKTAEKNVGVICAGCIRLFLLNSRSRSHQDRQMNSQMKQPADEISASRASSTGCLFQQVPITNQH